MDVDGPTWLRREGLSRLAKGEKELKMTPKVSVIICAYTLKRWDDLTAAVQSAIEQTLLPTEVIVVIDHNPELQRRAQEKFPLALVVENREAVGLSGARNRGIANATGDFMAFLDDDAVADADWLEVLTAHFEDQTVLGVGSRIEPAWQAKPTWFPDEFQWVVGCTYRGMPRTVESVRNLIGASMVIRREVFETAGGFRSGIGRVGNVPLGCEETELCIRARQQWPGHKFIYDPDAKVRHRVPAERVTWRYFRSRCYAEGQSKALISWGTRTSESLSSEPAYTLRTLPTGIAHGLQDALWRGDGNGLLRAGSIISGLLITTVGYLMGLMQQRSSQQNALRP